jgi:hypothetical protein
MILCILVAVFFNGFVLMLGILNVMRVLYAWGVCQRPQISTDHVRHISFERFVSHYQTVGAMTEASPLNPQAESVGL